MGFENCRKTHANQIKLKMQSSNPNVTA